MPNMLDFDGVTQSLFEEEQEGARAHTNTYGNLYFTLVLFTVIAFTGYKSMTFPLIIRHTKTKQLLSEQNNQNNLLFY